VRRQAGSGQHHGKHFHPLRPDGDLALAVTVGQPAAGHAEQHERHREDDRDHGNEGLALVPGQAHANDDGEHQVAQNVIAECALKLGGNQGPEAARPGGLLHGQQLIGAGYGFFVG
jgi:hypothetical protein